MQTYPMIRALVRHGGIAAMALAVVTFALGLFLATQTGAWIYAGIGALAGAVVYALLKSYVALVTIIADMMLPK